ncbi:MAG: FMN-binding negative transcriptional regulator [Candidatus Hydrogenedentes bacterium]|nr:FMN-binding negative transcriptional regulator [Candidatus Hydrogenedentota bacterium]
MYIPEKFAVDDPESIARFLDAYPFALLVSSGDSCPEAVHLPLIRLDAHTLYGHVARANPLWRVWTDAPRVLAIFSGPHAYISPRWYVSENNVPTWNYAAVHVQGEVALVDNDAHLPLLERMIAAFEGPDGWRLPEDARWVAPMLRGTVGFTIAIASIEAKFKMSQNKSEADARAAMAQLAASPRASDRETEEFMQGLRGSV